MRQSLNIVDWLLLLIVLLAAVRGCIRGFRSVLLDFAGLTGGLYAALRLSPAVAVELSGALPLPEPLIGTVAFGATFAVVCAGLTLLGRVVLAPRFRLPVPSLPGALAGLLAGIVIAALVAALLFSLPLPPPVTRATSESRFGARLAAPALRIGAFVVPR